MYVVGGYAVYMYVVSIENKDFFLTFLWSMPFRARLPDFSKYNVPKRVKIYQKDHKINQMAIKYSKWHYIYTKCEVSLYFYHYILES
jgi:hypothetical protein